MNSIPHSDENEQELNSSVLNFIKEYKISKLLRICHVEKEKGISALDVFRYLFCLIFSDRSKDWIAMICTNTEISENEVIRIYGKRRNKMPISAFCPICRYFRNADICISEISVL